MNPTASYADVAWAVIVLVAVCAVSAAVLVVAAVGAAFEVAFNRK